MVIDMVVFIGQQNGNAKLFSKIQYSFWTTKFGKFIKVLLPLHPVLKHHLSRKAEGLGPAMP
jgi:hypothetical protein